MSRRVLARCRAVHKFSQIGPADPRHTTCTDACKLWIDEKMKACVCVKSLNVHLCGDKCRLAPKLTPDNDGSVCPLTCMVVGNSPVVQQLQYTKAGKPIIHWTNQRLPRGKRRCKPTTSSGAPRRRKTTQVNPRSSSKIVLACLKQGVVSRAERHKKNVQKCEVIMRKKFQSDQIPISYTSLRNFFLAQQQLTHDAPCFITDAAQQCVSTTLASAIQRYFSKNPDLWIGNNDAAVATMLYLICDGWTIQGVTIVEHVRRLKMCLPRMQDVGLVSRLSCRSMSTGTRAFKHYALSDAGLPVYSKRFIFTNQERAALHRAFYM